MCWNAGVSLATAVIHAFCIGFLFHRNRYPTDRWMLPVLCSVLAVETLEYLLWPVVHGDVVEGAQFQLCHARNSWLTRLILVAVTAQPALMNLAAYKTGSVISRERFLVPLVLSVVLFFLYMAALVLGEVQQVALLNVLERGAKDFRGQLTCSYRGLNGHMHWVYGMSDHFLLPNALPYFLLILGTIFATPFRYVGAVTTFTLSLFVYIFTLFGGSMEAGSVWCWSALAIDLYLIIVLPKLEKKQVRRKSV